MIGTDYEAQFEGADLTDATFEGCDLSELDLSTARTDGIRLPVTCSLDIS